MTVTALRVPASPTLPFWKRLQTRLIFNFVLLAVGSIVLVTGVTLVQVHQQLNNQVFAQLESVAQLKESQIREWLRTTKTVVKLVKANVVQQTSITPLLQDRRVSASAKDEINVTLLQNVSGQMSEQANEQPILEEAFVYNAKGLIVSASNPAMLNRVVTLQPYFQPSLAEDYIQSPYYDVSTGKLTMMMTTPITSITGKVIGIMAARLNIAHLHDVTAERSGLGETVETYLVSTENNYLLT